MAAEQNPTVSDTQPAHQTPQAPQADRLTVDPSASFVVFLIGARVNRWWMLPAIWAVAGAMGRMMRELERDPELGLLGHESYTGRTTLAVQYWRSLDHLQRYAHAK